MIIEVLRLSHRLPRDCRISTHCALVARAFGAGKMYYSGMHDLGLEESVVKIVDKFGGPFAIEYIKNDKKLVLQKKKEGFIIVHLTVYGLGFQEECRKIKKEALVSEKDKKEKKTLIIVGGEKVEPFFYNNSDYNVAVGSQPHSEVAALALVLNELHGEKKEFSSAKIRIEGAKKGKIIKKFNIADIIKKQGF